MQRLSGQGMAFVEFDGYIKEYMLQPGQSIIVDTGYLAAMDSSCSIDIQTVPGLKNIMFGGEGVFNTVVTGPVVYSYSPCQSHKWQDVCAHIFRAENKR